MFFGDHRLRLYVTALLSFGSYRSPGSEANRWFSQDSWLYVVYEFIMLLNNLFQDLCWRIIYLTATFLGAYILYYVGYNLKEKYYINRQVKKKQTERGDELMRLEFDLPLKPEYDRILKMSEDDLIEKLQKRHFKAADVLRAFKAKAICATREHNCITEFIPQAEEWAKKLDQSKEIKGPLHGLPVSVKDNINVEGMDSTLGLGKRLYQPAEDNAVIIKVLLDLGAVPFCKTNVPQTLLSFECTNPIFGTTTNHLNSEFSPGGSSGGEATLIGAGASFIGIGSDIGGSVRIPAHYSGVASLKPTGMRISPKGFAASVPNIVGVTGVPGFVGKNTNVIRKVYQHILENNIQRDYDPLTLPLQFDSAAANSDSKLRIGYFTSLPFYPPIGDTEAVILDAKKALEAQGHTLVPFNMPDGLLAHELILDFTLADGGELFRKYWEHENVPKALYGNYIWCRMPRILRLTVSILAEYILPYFHSPRLAMIMKGGALKTNELWYQLGERRKMLSSVTDQWRQHKLDVLICPVLPFPAIHTNCSGKQPTASLYTMIWNMFDFPCGTVPFGKESGKNIDSYDHQGDHMLRLAKAAVKESANMPISVQVVGLPYNDEKVLNGMRILESLAPTSSKKLA